MDSHIRRFMRNQHFGPLVTVRPMANQVSITINNTCHRHFQVIPHKSWVRIRLQAMDHWLVHPLDSDHPIQVPSTTTLTVTIRTIERQYLNHHHILIQWQMDVHIHLFPCMLKYHCPMIPPLGLVVRPVTSVMMVTNYLDHLFVPVDTTENGQTMFPIVVSKHFEHRLRLKMYFKWVVGVKELNQQVMNIFKRGPQAVND